MTETVTHRVLSDKVARMLRDRSDRLSQVGEFLVTLLDKHPEAVQAYASLLATQSFLRVDAEEIETGLCCCRHVPDGDLLDDVECARCDGTGVSEYVVGPKKA